MTEKTGKMRMGKRRNQGKCSNMPIKVFSKKYILRQQASFCPAVKYYSWPVEFHLFCPCSSLTEVGAIIPQAVLLTEVVLGDKNADLYKKRMMETCQNY